MKDRATAPLQQPARADAPLDPAAPSSALADTRPAQLAKDDGLKVPQGSPSAATPSGEDEAARAAPAPAPAPAPAAADPSPLDASGRIAPFGNIAPPAPPPDLQSRLDEAAKIADPHLRQAVEANIRLLTQRERMAFTDQQRAAKAQAKAIIDQGGDLGTIPGKVLLQIDENGRQALHDYAAAHGNPRTDPVTYYALKNQALDDPAAFQGVDLGDHMARLDAKDYGELTQLQTSLRNGQPPADLPLQQVYKANTDRMLQQLGLPSGIFDAGTRETAAADMEPAQDAAPQLWQTAAQLRKAVDLGLTAYQFVHGRPATPAEQQQLLDQAVIDRQIGTRRDAANHLPAPRFPQPSSAAPEASPKADATTADPGEIPPLPRKGESPSAQQGNATSPRADKINADTSESNTDQQYGDRRFDFLAKLEGNRSLAYDDATGQTVAPSSKKSGKITVGVGFNMDRPGARDAFAKYLPGVSFDDVYSGKRSLSLEESHRLLDFTAQEAEKIVTSRFKDAELTDNQRLALVSLAFNTPSLIGPHLVAAMESGDTAGALNEILNNSNKNRNKGLASRRWQEAEMFAGEAHRKDLPAYAEYMKQFQ